MLTRRDALRTEITRLARARPGHFERRAGRVARETSAPVTPRRLDHSRVVPIHLSRARRTFARHAASRPAGERRVRAFFSQSRRARFRAREARPGNAVVAARPRPIASGARTRSPTWTTTSCPRACSPRSAPQEAARTARTTRYARVSYTFHVPAQKFSPAPDPPRRRRAARAFARLDPSDSTASGCIGVDSRSLTSPPRYPSLPALAGCAFVLTLLALRQRAVAHHALSRPPGPGRERRAGCRAHRAARALARAALLQLPEQPERVSPLSPPRFPRVAPDDALPGTSLAEVFLTISRPPASHLRLPRFSGASKAAGDRKRSNLGKTTGSEHPSGLEEVAMSADAAVLAAVNALAQSPLRPGVLDDVQDVASVAALRKQVRARKTSLRPPSPPDPPRPDRTIPDARRATPAPPVAPIPPLREKRPRPPPARGVATGPPAPPPQVADEKSPPLPAHPSPASPASPPMIDPSPRLAPPPFPPRHPPSNPRSSRASSTST